MHPDTSRTGRDMTRWLGDGGMPLLSSLGASFVRYGSEGRLGWVAGAWRPTAPCANPHGTVQGGLHAVVHDAAMNFALNAGLPAGSHTRATLSLHLEMLRPARPDEVLELVGEAVHVARQVAWAEARVFRGRTLVSRSTATFLLEAGAEHTSPPRGLDRPAARS